MKEVFNFDGITDKFYGWRFCRIKHFIYEMDNKTEGYEDICSNLSKFRSMCEFLHYTIMQYLDRRRGLVNNNWEDEVGDLFAREFDSLNHFAQTYFGEIINKPKEINEFKYMDYILGKMNCYKFKDIEKAVKDASYKSEKNREYALTMLEQLRGMFMMGEELSWILNEKHMEFIKDHIENMIALQVKEGKSNV